MAAKIDQGVARKSDWWYLSAVKTKWLKPVLIALAVLLAIGAALRLFLSFDHYIPQIEKEASARLNQPVTVKSIHFSAFPLPHVTIEGITVGTTDDIKLGKIRVTPDLFSLMQSTTVIKTIEIDAPELTRKGFDRIPSWSKPDDAKSPPPVPGFRVESIRLAKAVFRLGKTGFGPFEARIGLDSEGRPGEATIATDDGKFKLHIKPDQANYLIDARAKSWTLPVEPALAFDELTIKGVATSNDARFSEVSAKLYGGTATGKISVGWQKGLRVNGALDVTQLEMQKVASILSPGAHVSGKLNAKPVFSASAATADQLMSALHLETAFSVQSGTIHGVDIQKAATHLIKQGTTGGETRFEQLAGNVTMDRGSYRFTDLKVVSGALAAEGNMTVSAKNELSGRINAQVAGLGGLASVPLNVTGTVDAPLLYPTGGTMAGAAVGTMMMGPGIGTSVGAKVGGWAEGLFGKKEETKSKK